VLPTVEIYRDANIWIDRARAYKIVIDNAPAGEIRRGETVVLEVPVGHHELFLKVDWARSQRLDVDLLEDERQLVRCWNSLNPLTFLYKISFGRLRYISIEALSGCRDHSVILSP
jgi:hypothetical protein